MLERLVHRGPDDVGELTIGATWLGHTRLSIVDVVGGHQPLRTPDARAAIVVNGEIYNHKELRQTISGVAWQTDSDSEVALHIIDREGSAGLPRLRGMFALAYADDREGLLLARDPVGIKPLYWARRHGSVVAASELKAFDPPLRAHVEAFPPGHYWTPQDGLRRFADAVPQRVKVDPSGPLGDDAEERVRTALIAAVERRMMGDVPVGCFLSGGLDSSLVAAIASRWMHRRGLRLQTFAVGTEGSADLAAARVVAAALDTDHREAVCTEEEVLAAVPDVVRSIEHFDPSLVRSAIANYLVARLAAAHVKVVLTGEGADELFGGYEYLHAGDFDQPERLHAELVRSVEELHGLNLQRCDRVTMAHGLEGRVPFLDLDVIETALSLPASAKVPTPDRMEKDLLRRAFRGWIPDAVLWRAKEQFGDGSGVAEIRSRVSATVPATDFAFESPLTRPPLRSREEVAYHRIWSTALAPTRPEATLSRFATT